MRNGYKYNKGSLDTARGLKDVIDRGHTLETVKQCIENVIYNASQVVERKEKSQNKSSDHTET